MEGALGPLFVALVNFAIFIIFVQGIVEVIKAWFFIGIPTLIKNLWAGAFGGKKLDGSTISFINFLVALFACWAWDYGLISRVIESGTKMHEGPAGWIDWIGTAAAAAQGASWVFDKFVATAKMAKNAEKEIKQ